MLYLREDLRKLLRAGKRGVNRMQIPDFLDKYKDFFEEEIPVYKSANTIQIFLIRETHDFSIFRTEETRELNIVTLPRSIDDFTATIRVVMLASKQKAVENRKLAELIKTYAREYNILQPKDDRLKCSLKDNLCMKCPRCVLFGAVSTKGEQRWNIKHRIEYSSAYSLEDYEEISELITFNAVETTTQSTGQALGYTENVRPVAHFPSIITLHSVTWKEFLMILKAILATKSYGAETRVKGDTVNHIVGITFGYEELMTSLELTLELAKVGLSGNILETVKNILEQYRNEAVFKDKVMIIAGEELKDFLDKVKRFEITKDFINAMYSESEAFTKKIEEIVKSTKTKRKK